MDPTLILAQAEAAPLSLGLRVPLSLMHFLEFAIWGAWWVVLGNYLNQLQFSRRDIGRVYATMSIGSIIAPMLVGTIADRYFPSEWVMAVCHIAGAVLLFFMARIRTARAFYWVALAYALVFSPTLALVNSIVFANIEDAARDFGGIRVLGTIGWIVAGLSLKFFLRPGEPVNNRPLLLAAVLSGILGVFSFFLPHTPPKGTGEIPFIKALELFSDPSFAVFFGISFLITIALAFYFSFTSLYLEQHIGIRPPNIGPLMSIGQCFEIIFLVSLGWFLENLGMKSVLALGMLAWGLRYGLFAIGKPFLLVLVGIGLHGICFDFFFAAGFVYVEQAAPEAIQASGQALFAVLTYGFGMYLGTEASGWLNQRLTKQKEDPTTGNTVAVTEWSKFWLVPCIGVVTSLLLFLLLF